MLSSDWSSDVCSSDLEPASLDEEIVEPVMMNPVPRPFERHCAGIGEIVHAAIGEMADRPAFLPIDMEDGAGDPRPEVPHFLQRHAIGRASCRERVCQYV